MEWKQSQSPQKAEVTRVSPRKSSPAFEQAMPEKKRRGRPVGTKRKPVVSS